MLDVGPGRDIGLPHHEPLLVVIEDVHWLDSETQALLDRLVDSLPTARILLLVNYRPEYQHGWGSKTSYTQLRLDPLPLTSAEDLLHALLGDDASLVSVKRLLIARIGGNPFFLEESLQTLVETGVLVGVPGPIVWCRRRPPSRCRPRCRRCWQRASTACPLRRSTSSRWPPSLARRFPCPCCKRLLSYPRQHSMATWRTSRPPSSCTKRVSSQSARTPSSTP
jgi:hypothetical protein